MKKIYGVEMTKPKGQLPGFIAQIVKKTAEIAKIYDRDQNLLIIENEQQAVDLESFFQSKGVLGETFTLYHLEDPTEYPTFTDYGFISVSGQAYLFEDMTIPFEITSGNDKQVKMATLQIEEHLIGIESGLKQIYFIDKQLKELIEGIAAAYKIHVSFVSI